MIDESKLFLTEADIENFSTEDFLATEEETNMFYEQVLCEWRVDPDKKKKLIQDVCNSLQRYINSSKNEIVKKGVQIYKPALITKANNTLLQNVFGKSYNQTRTRRLLIGHYNFNLKELAKYYNPSDKNFSQDSPKKVLKKCFTEVNGDFSEATLKFGAAKEIKLLQQLISCIPIPGLSFALQVAAEATYGQKAGTIWVDVTKKGIKREGAEFATSVLDELFNE